MNPLGPASPYPGPLGSPITSQCRLLTLKLKTSAESSLLRRFDENLHTDLLRRESSLHIFRIVTGLSAMSIKDLYLYFVSIAHSGAIVVGPSEIAVHQVPSTYRSKSFQ